MNRKKNTLPSRSTPRRPGEQGPRTVSVQRGEDEVLGSAGSTGSRPKEPQRYRPVKKRARFAATSDDSSSDEERVTTRRQVQESSSEESEVIEGSDDEKKGSPKALYSPPESDLSDEASLARRARRPAKAPAGTQAGLKMSLLTENEREAILRQERAPKPPKKAKRKRGIQRSSLKKTLKPKKKEVSGEESHSDEVEEVPEGTPDPNPDEPATAGTSEQEPKIKPDEIPDEEIQEPKQSEPVATPEPEPVQIKPKLDAEQPEEIQNTPDQDIIVNLELVQESMELQVEPEQEPKTEIQEQALPAEQDKDVIGVEDNLELPSDKDTKVAEENNQDKQENESTPEQAPKLAPEDKEPDDGSAAERPKERE